MHYKIYTQLKHSAACSLACSIRRDSAAAVALIRNTAVSQQVESLARRLDESQRPSVLTTQLCCRPSYHSTPNTKTPCFQGIQNTHNSETLGTQRGIASAEKKGLGKPNVKTPKRQSCSRGHLRGTRCSWYRSAWDTGCPWHRSRAGLGTSGEGRGGCSAAPTVDLCILSTPVD